MWKIFHTEGDLKRALESAHWGEAFPMHDLWQSILPGIRLEGSPRAAQQQWRKAVQVFPLPEGFQTGECSEVPRAAPQQGEGVQVPDLQ